MPTTLAFSPAAMTTFAAQVTLVGNEALYTARRGQAGPRFVDKENTVQFRLWLGLLLASLCLNAFAFAGKDVAGSRDHPLLSRYAGARINYYKVIEHDEYSLVLSAPTAKGAPVNRRTVAGKLTRISYELPKNASIAAVWQSYQQAIDKGGFSSLFACQQQDCGAGALWEKEYRHTYLPAREDLQRHALLKRTDKLGTVYLTLHAAQADLDDSIYVVLDVLEEQALADDLVTTGERTTPASLTDALKTEGKASVYDLYFDTDKAALKTDSTAALEAIAAVLKAEPTLKLYVVGHTDTVGQIEHNLALSSKRADTVIQALVTQFAISKDRLRGYGAGPFAPVASNADEKNRSRNRRVELVRAP